MLSCPVPVHKVVSRMNDVWCVSGKMAPQKLVPFARLYLKVFANKISFKTNGSLMGVFI